MKIAALVMMSQICAIEPLKYEPHWVKEGSAVYPVGNNLQQSMLSQVGNRVFMQIDQRTARISSGIVNYRENTIIS